MTSGEALRIATSIGGCFVVFHRDTGEVLSVRAFDPREENALPAIQAELGATGGPAKGRFFPAGTLTTEALEAEKADSRAAVARTRTYADWSSMTGVQMARLLDAGASTAEIPEDMGTQWVIERLFTLRRRDLTAEIVGNLQILGRAGRLKALANLLRIRLAGFARDSATLGDLWEQATNGVEVFALMDEAGRIRTTDPRLIARLREVLQKSVFGSAKDSALRALGRIGAAAWEAADAVRETAQASGERTRARGLAVLKRLETPAEAWIPCDRCDDGFVQHESASGWFGAEPCPHCDGLGVMHRR